MEDSFSEVPLPNDASGSELYIIIITEIEIFIRVRPFFVPKALLSIRALLQA